MRETDRRRAVSTTLAYVLMLSVASLLVVGLLTAGGGFVGDQREQVIRAELDVVGQQLASDVTAADRMVEAAHEAPSAVRVGGEHPREVTGASYRITLVEGSDPHLELESMNPQVQVTVELSNATDLGQSQVGGGDVAVVYDSSDQLVIERA